MRIYGLPHQERYHAHQGDDLPQPRGTGRACGEYIHAHDSMIDEVHGNTYFSEPIAFEMDDGDIKETIRPYAMGRIIDIESFLQDYPCDPDGGTLYIELEIEDHLLFCGTTAVSGSVFPMEHVC